jgi:hypothetical protein
MIYATHIGILTSVRSTTPFGMASLLAERSSTAHLRGPVSSVVCLAPLYFPRKTVRPVSYYALFKGWLLLSQPPGCLYSFTSFPT